MSALILELKQGESMILNGAVIRFKTRTRLELSTQSRFLFGKQIMQAEDVRTPAQRIYFTLQQAYIGDEQTRPEALAEARRLIDAARADSAAARRDFLDHMLAVIAENADFEALKLARQIIREEAAADF
jgi:flagellar biosynthesis repressor protein FlbT